MNVRKCPQSQISLLYSVDSNYKSHTMFCVVTVPIKRCISQMLIMLLRCLRFYRFAFIWAALQVCHHPYVRDVQHTILLLESGLCESCHATICLHLPPTCWEKYYAVNMPGIIFVNRLIFWASYGISGKRVRRLYIVCVKNFNLFSIRHMCPLDAIPQV